MLLLEAKPDEEPGLCTAYRVLWIEQVVTQLGGRDVGTLEGWESHGQAQGLPAPQSAPSPECNHGIPETQGSTQSSNRPPPMSPQSVFLRTTG